MDIYICSYNYRAGVLGMVDYIYTILYPYVTLTNIVILCSIVLPILVIGIFWQSAVRTRVIQILGDINKRYKNGS
jgi:hypothetical protein